jgi:putative pyruvate formate lyase activating enzyme
MHRQVGDLVINENGDRGTGSSYVILFYRANLGTSEVVKFIAEEISINTYVNIMDQYYPCYKAMKTLRSTEGSQAGNTLPRYSTRSGQD